MGFLSAVFGIVIADHSNEGILKFISSTYEVIYPEEKEEEVVYKFKLHPDIGCSLSPEKDDFYECTAYEFAGCGFFYTKNKNIKIGSPTSCMGMIYLAEVDVYNYNQDFSDKDLSDLLAWKNILLSQERLGGDSSFCLSRNCCS